ncbi:MAG: hypothetical protein COZ46_00595 [Verrucomicrobia bacterium CG_4_10_14_3_um_filter_43_23]|nr:MAG: hypothetical protein AUJ82_04345 [Verrucomicrobia bacterium CG1_02_43_26]PIP59071.1 MAG: hypothetical protein COX01_05865 [Verrucomicrobia bacterium CG22_combo_CG10-13_8_21_14_all_43_17]PIX59168.1 MAG: hypothetical protein COZ46_00595 [Verrucomicrobia bacterium CG_4_10_14_3_um_filter_43_23]PIY61307.1 MAG: hypothetical protein COY94_05515 [Verrucomicrobia bacterium CG_4_10_14_0_8_um_filter_43_34]PJA44089.1 MAG: hypothetical protein CO175_04230 [Verrucomicrobia bacterium CG_4_9_14_3_um_fi
MDDAFYTTLVSDYCSDPVLILQHDEQDPTITFVNKAFQKVYAYSQKEILNKPFSFLSRGIPHPLLADLFKQGRQCRTKIEHTTKSGKTLALEIRSNPVFNETGKLTHWACSLSSIEEKQQFQESLLHIASQLRHILKSIPIVLWGIDAEDRFSLVEGKGLESIKMVSDDFLHRDYKIIFNDYPDILEMFRLAKVEKINSAIRLFNGIYFDVQFSVLKDEQGNYDGLIGVAIDVNDRMLAEETRERLISILEATSDLILIEDSKNITYLNAAGQKLLGYTEAEIKSKLLKDLYPQWSYDLIQTVAIPYAMENGTWSGEAAFLCKNGHEVPTSQVIIAHKSKAGELQFFSNIARDISESKKTEKHLREAKDKAESATRAKSEFLANMSHEIRTPLNAILGFAEILAHVTVNTAMQSYAESIIVSGKNLLHLINDLLDLSKIEAGKIDIIPRPTSVKDLIEEIKTLFTLESKKKHLRFDVFIDKSIPDYIMLDTPRFRQIVFNVIGNAIKYTNEGFVSLKLFTKESPKNKKLDLFLVIEDSGIGISEEDQETIFSPFIQKCEHAGGVGLGLTITLRLVKMMRGKISLTSTPGKGSCFTICIPNVKKCTIEGASGSIIQIDNEPPDFDKATVLIVDDMEYNINLLRAYLSDCNVDIIEARNGKEALLMAEELHPKIILLDLKMPIMDGYEAMARISANPDIQSIPVIAITAQTLGDEEARIRKLGSKSFLRKPLSKATLITELKKFIPVKKPSLQKQNPQHLLEPKERIQILNALKGKHFNTWQTVKSKSIIRNIKEFATELKQIPNAEFIPALAIFADQLIKAADLYDIEKTQSLLNEYPQIILQIEAYPDKQKTLEMHEKALKRKR